MKDYINVIKEFMRVHQFTHNPSMGTDLCWYFESKKFLLMFDASLNRIVVQHGSEGVVFEYKSLSSAVAIIESLL